MAKNGLFLSTFNLTRSEIEHRGKVLKIKENIVGQTGWTKLCQGKLISFFIVGCHQTFRPLSATKRELRAIAVINNSCILGHKLSSGGRIKRIYIGESTGQVFCLYLVFTASVKLVLSARQNMPRRRSLSCDFLDFPGRQLDPEFTNIERQPRSHSARKKSVQWSNDLEEVRYYPVPKRSRSESIRRKIQKVKRRAEKFTDAPLKALNGLNGTVTAGRRRLQFVTAHSHGRSCFSLDSNFQSFEEYDKQWDVLFELARQRREKTAIMALTSGWTRPDDQATQQILRLTVQTGFLLRLHRVLARSWQAQVMFSWITARVSGENRPTQTRSEIGWWT